jgi:hypothetical protein
MGFNSGFKRLNKNEPSALQIVSRTRKMSRTMTELFSNIIAAV